MYFINLAELLLSTSFAWHSFTVVILFSISDAALIILHFIIL